MMSQLDSPIHQFGPHTRLSPPLYRVQYDECRTIELEDEEAGLKALSAEWPILR